MEHESPVRIVARHRCHFLLGKFASCSAELLQSNSRWEPSQDLTKFGVKLESQASPSRRRGVCVFCTRCPRYRFLIPHGWVLSSFVGPAAVLLRRTHDSTELTGPNSSQTSPYSINQASSGWLFDGRWCCRVDYSIGHTYLEFFFSACMWYSFCLFGWVLMTRRPVQFSSQSWSRQVVLLSIIAISCIYTAITVYFCTVLLLFMTTIILIVRYTVYLCNTYGYYNNILYSYYCMYYYYAYYTNITAYLYNNAVITIHYNLLCTSIILL